MEDIINNINDILKELRKELKDIKINIKNLEKKKEIDVSKEYLELTNEINKNNLDIMKIKNDNKIIKVKLDYLKELNDENIKKKIKDTNIDYFIKYLKY
jgi:hypothetical protein